MLTLDKTMEFYEITVRDFKVINEIIKDNYGFSISDYVTIPVRRRLVELINSGVAKNIEELKEKLSNKAIDKEWLLSFFLFDTTEMFRDPSVWRFLGAFLKKKEKVLKTKIWFPLCVDGLELYSLLILLKITGLEDDVEVTVNVPIEKNLSEIKDELVLSEKKMEISEGNFKRLELKVPYTLHDFFEKGEHGYIIKSGFRTQVRFVKGFELKTPVRAQDIIIYRNKMLYYTVSKSMEIIEKLMDAMLPGAILMIGVNEQLKYMKGFNLLPLNENDGIYKKK